MSLLLVVFKQAGCKWVGEQMVNDVVLLDHTVGDNVSIDGDHISGSITANNNTEEPQWVN